MTDWFWSIAVIISITTTTTTILTIKRPTWKRCHWSRLNPRSRWQMVLPSLTALPTVDPWDWPHRGFAGSGLSRTSVAWLVILQNHWWGGDVVQLVEHSFSYQAPVIWNQLPVSVCHSTSVSSFKSSLKTFLFLKTFCSVSLPRLPWYVTGVCVCLCVCVCVCMCVCVYANLCVCMCVCMYSCCMH